MHIHTHTLTQNSHYEFWCGLYLTCKKKSNYTWQEWVRDKTREISKSSSMANENCRLRQQCSREEPSSGKKSTCRFLAWPVAISEKSWSYQNDCKLCPRHPCQDMQVQVVDQTTHPPKCHSFVGLDRQIGSSPPAVFGMMQTNPEIKTENSK